jgi:hypothetical protein
MPVLWLFVVIMSVHSLVYAELWGLGVALAVALLGIYLDRRTHND